MRAGSRRAERPAATRAEIPPRSRRGRRGCRAGARRSTGSASAVASRADGDEPAPGENRVAAAELGGEGLRLEVALENLPAGAVIQGALLPLLAGDVRLDGRVDDHELPGHAPGLAAKRLPVGRLEMPVEVCGEDALERAVLERELERVAANVCRVGRLAAGLVEHRIALVEADDLPRQVPGQESGAAGDVERSCRRESL